MADDDNDDGLKFGLKSFSSIFAKVRAQTREQSDAERRSSSGDDDHDDDHQLSSSGSKRRRTSRSRAPRSSVRRTVVDDDAEVKVLASLVARDAIEINDDDSDGDGAQQLRDRDLQQQKRKLDVLEQQRNARLEQIRSYSPLPPPPARPVATPPQNATQASASAPASGVEDVKVAVADVRTVKLRYHLGGVEKIIRTKIDMHHTWRSICRSLCENLCQRPQFSQLVECVIRFDDANVELNSTPSDTDVDADDLLDLKLRFSS